MDPSNEFEHPPYHERYCAFVDILGFGSLVNRLSQREGAFQSLRKLLSQVHNPEKGTTKSWHTEFRAQSISDAVAISTLPNSVGIVELMNATQNLTLELLHLGYFVRGATVKGMLYHDENMVFGEALVRAYQLEREVVRFPRIMVLSNVVEDVLRYCNQHQLGIEVSKRLRRADDGPWHVHVLRGLELLHENPRAAPNPAHHDSIFFEHCRMRIAGRLEQAVDNPRHFEKVKWFVNYWNAINLPLTGGITMINWPSDPPIPF